MGKLSNPLPIFAGLDGGLLTGGVVYIGEAGKNPETNPTTVFWDQLLQQPAAQPIPLLGGYPVRSGTPTNIYGSSNDYSITVRDNKGRLVFSCLNAAGLFSNTSDVLITPVKFGATGDGVTDDTAAVQAAISASYGKTLFFPAGTYLCSDLSVAGNLEFIGAPGATIKYKAGGATALVYVTGTSTFFKSTGITYDANGANQSGYTTTIRFGAVGTSTVPATLILRDNKFINGDGQDVWITSDTNVSTLENIFIENNTFLGGKEGTYTLSTTFILSSSGVNLQINNNYIDFCATPTTGGKVGIDFFVSGYTIWPGSQGSISGNTIINCGRSSTNPSAGVLGAIDGYYGAHNMSIVGNTIVTPWGRGIQVKSNAYNLSVVGNNVIGLGDLTAGASVDAQIVVNRSTNTQIYGAWNITGNTCVDSGSDGISVSCYNSDLSAAASPVAISNNIIKNATRRGIGMYQAKTGLVSGNIIEGGCSNAGIYVSSIIETAAVTGNTCKGLTGTDLIIATPGTSVIDVSDNRLLSTTPYALGGTDAGNVRFSNNRTAVANAINAYSQLNDMRSSQLDWSTGGSTANATVSQTPVLAPGTYEVVMEGDCTAGAGGLALFFSSTLTVSYFRVNGQTWNGATMVDARQYTRASGSPNETACSYSGAVTHYRVVVTMVVTAAGYMSLRGNQNAANADVTSIFQGATMKITRIA